jgi:pyruvate dehydrogenase E1 component alpha subunit
MPARDLDGSDAETVWEAAGESIAAARTGKGPLFILATCKRPQGHFLGDMLLRTVNAPVRELGRTAGPLVKAVFSPGGASLKERAGSLKKVVSLLGKTAKDKFSDQRDPLVAFRKKFNDQGDLEKIEEEVNLEIKAVVEEVLRIYQDYSKI